MSLRRRISGTIALALLPLLVKSAAAALTPAQIAERATPSVVLIRVKDGVGTGFVTGNGQVATNLHVIAGATEATVVTSDGRELTAIEVVGTDQAHDLAVLKVADLELKPLPLGRSSAVKPGEHVVAIGHPLGLGNTVSDGLVSAVRAISPELTMLQISAPISPGSSGGPLFNDRGEVIGISTLIVTRGQNLNFGIPIDVLKALPLDARGTPLAEVAVTSGGRRRSVPTHDLALLNDCPAEGRIGIAKRIGSAIELGAPLYNAGNIEACYRIYASTALEIDKAVARCAGPRRTLLDGVKKADSLDSYDDKAWAMRDAFDGVLDVIERSLTTTNTATSRPPASPARPIPHHPATLLKSCNRNEVDTIARMIGGAIQSGAPLYNDGNVEACYRIYEGAIRDIDRKGTCPAASKVLQDGLHNADALDDWSSKAWALRDAFDGLLEVIDRTR